MEEIDTFENLSLDKEKKADGLKNMCSKFSLIGGIFPYYDYVHEVCKLLIHLCKSSYATFVNHQNAIANSGCKQEIEVSYKAKLEDVIEILSIDTLSSQYSITLDRFIFQIKLTDDIDKFKEFLGLCKSKQISKIRIELSDVDLANKVVKLITAAKLYNSIDEFIDNGRIDLRLPKCFETVILFCSKLTYSSLNHDLKYFKAVKLLDFSGEPPENPFKTIALKTEISADNFEILKLHSSKTFNQTLRYLKLNCEDNGTSNYKDLGAKAGKLYPKLKSIHIQIRTTNLQFKIYDVDLNWKLVKPQL